MKGRVIELRLDDLVVATIQIHTDEGVSILEQDTDPLEPRQGSLVGEPMTPSERVEAVKATYLKRNCIECGIACFIAEHCAPGIRFTVSGMDAKLAQRGVPGGASAHMTNIRGHGVIEKHADEKAGVWFACHPSQYQRPDRRGR
jgi:hypothetical protein